ncbi:MAG TPA: cytochrome c biogenesis protein ResB [Propionibacteriaceae bacterium]|nr:cytochrome c biogenesis protein ResB [Propionibacteriaceae bacterium]
MADNEIDELTEETDVADDTLRDDTSIEKTAEDGMPVEVDEDGLTADDPGIAGSRARRPAAEVAPPGGFVGSLKFAWAVLTSMRTAIILLLLLAVAAIPGGILPQRPVNPFAVTTWLADHTKIGPFLDKIGMFDVYHTPWFSSIYLLLFVSLVGCIVPRTSVYLRALRAPAATPPRRVSRMSGAASYTASAPAEQLLTRAQESLRKRRYRVRRVGDVVCAERGYTRELGNLTFHVALLGVLLAVGYGSLLGHSGSAIVVEGQGFSNTLTQYDDISSGAAFNGRLDPFSVRLDAFHVAYETGPVQRGAAREFKADVTVTTPSGTRSDVIQVNEPLSIGSSKVHLVGHGYAAVVTVRDGNGNVAYSGPVVFQPLDSNLKSVGAINVPDARPQRLGLQGYFLPTASVGHMGPVSLFPEALSPELFLTAWAGPPKAETGQPQSVFTLDTTGMTQLTANNDLLRLELAPGDSYVLPNGLGIVTFDGWKRWVKLQVSSTPGMGAILAFVLLAVAGMGLSLSVKPRRAWLMAADGRVWTAGADRVDGRSGVGDDIAAVAAELGLEKPPPEP